MTRRILSIIAMLNLCAAGVAHADDNSAGAAFRRAINGEKSDVRSFELTPIAPPVPALKYQLLYDNLAERRPGNAAILYLDAVLMMGADAKEKAGQAMELRESKNKQAFNQLADSLVLPNVFQELELAALRDECDWQPPFREMGAQTLLPHLEPMVHGLAGLVTVRASRQIDQGDVTGALATLRLGYEMADKIGHEPVLVSALVSLKTTAMMDNCLAQLMSRPESPNLYWALAEYPSRHVILRRAFDGERHFIAASVPLMAKKVVGEKLTADDWRAVLKSVAELVSDFEGSAQAPDPVESTSPSVLERARHEYANANRLTADEVAKLDPAIVLGTYYFDQYNAAADERFKLRGLAYPVQLAMSDAHAARLASLIEEQPANPFLKTLPALQKCVLPFARADRELAALTAVEALRSYAAAHDGKLPARLDDVTETPVPENPVIGRPFEYRVEGETATIADSQSETTLTYTVHIRK
jgi:hypothetical protein